MLDSVTRKKIDDLRQILVGKITNPQSQVEQITTGLIYKFMYDMDTQAVEMGGIPSFFVDEFERYSWKHLFNPKLGGVEKVKLYTAAIENLYNNPHAPSIFREIFKNSFLPFKDPYTLNMFLKEINEFHYSNSEQLGDAYEYLLSFMGSQGDAGQFRTPRHIIDFIIEIVNPKKNETILDPACGTSGFLISAYKHILTQNTQARIGDKLNAAERKRVGNNLVGYDIDPAMTRISLVNMYLHNFSSPNISEYDTLSSEDRWNEYFDVILANPPFFSPTGGIKPHSRFGVNSTRSEVLFVDYIMEHLKPYGRAGIIVPEGIIFQTGTAYKNLRKKLIENSLIGVISLPAGVFQPYSGVKTSILILDKKIHQISDNIFFAQVDNDGFSLGAQRKPIHENDLPTILNEIQNYLTSKGLSEETEKIWSVKKSKLEKEPNYLLSPERYKVISKSSSKFEIVSLESVCISIEDGDWIESKDQSEEGIRLIQTGNIGVGQYLDKPEKARFISNETFKRLNCRSLKSKNILVSRLPHPVGRACLKPSLEINSITSVDVAILDIDETKIIPKYFIFLSQSLGYKNEINRYLTGSSRQRISKSNLKKVEIPLPNLKLQKDIVEELESYQKIIDGCRQIIENFKPTINIDSSWIKKNMGEVCDVRDGTHDSPKYVTKGYPLVTSKNVVDGNIDFSNVNYISEEDLHKINKRSKVDKGDILMPMIGTIGRPTIVEFEKDFAIKNVALIKCDEDLILSSYVRTILDSDYFADYLRRNQKGSTQKFISLGALRSFPLPIPSIKIQSEITQNIEEQISIVKGNNRLIKIYTQKIMDRVNKIWGD